MKKGILAAFALFLLPLFASAQATLATYILGIGNFLNRYVIPLLLALAFFFFVWNAFRFFVMGGASGEGQEKAKSLALWGIFAFVLIISTWGLVNLVVTSFNIGQPTPVCPDYYPNC